MRHRPFAALLILLPLAAAAPAFAGTRLGGPFTMTGRVTVAQGVPGEHVGEPVTRRWSFLAPCAAGQCVTEKLIRSRATGSDTLTLVRPGGIGGEPDRWVGRGRFYAPLRCGGRVHPRGEQVVFTISVRITAVAIVGGAPVATAVAATYRDTRRMNMTRCVAALGHDAAAYTGVLAPSSS